MSAYDHAGRIPKQAFVVTCLVLLALCLLSSIARFYIRICVHHEFGIDDVSLVFGLCCMICAIVLILIVIDSMYMTESLFFGVGDISYPPDLMERSFYYRKISAISLILAWLSIGSVKISFLALFKRLIDRITPLTLYWWCVLIFNLAILAYGVSVYILACPYFYSYRALRCETGPGLKLAKDFSLSQMALDIAGDLMILFIPIRLIWKIRIRWSQKIALFCSLCLTVVIVVFTIVRASGIQSDGKLDSIWETFWLLTAGEVGLILTAMTAFRTLFVAKRKAKRQRNTTSRQLWYDKSRNAIARWFTFLSWRSTLKDSQIKDPEQLEPQDGKRYLPSIPGGTMTGVRSFINGVGKTRGSGVMRSIELTVANEDELPFADANRSRGGISVQHDISTSSIQGAESITNVADKA